MHQYTPTPRITGLAAGIVVTAWLAGAIGTVAAQGGIGIDRAAAARASRDAQVARRIEPAPAVPVSVARLDDATLLRLRAEAAR